MKDSKIAEFIHTVEILHFNVLILDKHTMPAFSGNDPGGKESYIRVDSSSM